MKRDYCSHRMDSVSVLFISWCRRCSGWRVTRAYSELGSFWEDGSSRVCESHFLPVEEGGLDDTIYVVQRALLASQEMAEDLADAQKLDFDWGEGA
jgi:hypothetical protein